MHRTTKLISQAVFGILLLLAADLRAEQEAAISKGQTLYVPVYSHIYGGDRERPLFLAATLSIRNIDPAQAITVTAVDYYDSEGKLLKHFLSNPVSLAAMASTRHVIKSSDKAGGSGANFIVTWQSKHVVNAPIVEAVMIGTQSQQGISFTSRGMVIRHTP